MFMVKSTIFSLPNKMNFSSSVHYLPFEVLSLNIQNKILTIFISFKFVSIYTTVYYIFTKLIFLLSELLNHAKAIEAHVKELFPLI